MPIKQQFPALLRDGFHEMSIVELRKLCVTRFDTSITRRGIMAGFVKIVKKLNAAGTLGEIWVNGSFVTEKIDPEDVDILIRVASNVYAGNPAIRAAVDWASADELCDTHSCDSYKWIEYNEGHPLFRKSEEDRRYFTPRWRGHVEGYTVKGVVVVSLPAEI